MSVYGHFQTEICIGPQCKIKIYNPSNSKLCSEILAIVDSGAVATCIPESNIQSIGNLVKGQDVRTKDFNNGTKSRETYHINIRIPGTQPDIMCVRVISVPGKKYAVIGRDILNKFKVVLDAPNNQWILNCNGSCDLTSPAEPTAVVN
jgi:Retroviral aspartyl protease